MIHLPARQSLIRCIVYRLRRVSRFYHPLPILTSNKNCTQPGPNFHFPLNARFRNRNSLFNSLQLPSAATGGGASPPASVGADFKQR